MKETKIKKTRMESEKFLLALSMFSIMLQDLKSETYEVMVLKKVVEETFRSKYPKIFPMLEGYKSGKIGR